MTDIDAVLTDIEGTTTPIAYVHDTLFGYARRHLDSFVAEHRTRDDVDACLAATQALAPDADPLGTLHAWMDADAKVAPLKTLQGLIWQDGYASGELVAQLYPDVAPALRRWYARGLGLAVYSSGSTRAQRLIFGHAGCGDLTGLFTAFFDTAVGGKRDAASYRAIATSLGRDANRILFLSDVGAELDAAAAAGMQTTQLARPQDGTVPVTNHQVADSFDAITLLADIAAVGGR